HLLVIVELGEMLYGAFVLEYRSPGLGRVPALRREHRGERRILHRKRAGQRLVCVDVRGDWLDAGTRAAADDADTRRRCDRELAAETFQRAPLGGIWTGAPLDGECSRGFVGLCAQMPEHFEVPALRECALER